MTDFVMHSMADVNRLMGHLQAQDFGKPKVIVIKDQDRSGEQNKKLHACLSDIAKQVEHAGKKWDVLIWKRLLTAAWLRESGEQPQLIPAVDGNGFDVVYERTSKLSVKQCASLLEWIQAFGAEHQVRWSQKDLWEGRY
ncbi:P21 prophage-derived protein NinB [Pseudomonas reidholzensis]|uniref:P21 prophage-derived protein NinB n=2 Tax=Pseudomonas reidholzensis TaxID=1785162 RepID=A0A383RT20_9PSED|nr:recombination protein NinB [Pseudomonas reidholzensis]SYX89943.1 P21 prophage-derived protein NinB [Pseudomonas reidholzensis]